MTVGKSPGWGAPSVLVVRVPELDDGMFPEVIAHLALDRAAGSVDVDHVRSRLQERIPHRATADRVDLQWRHSHDGHVRQTWGFGA